MKGTQSIDGLGMLSSGSTVSGTVSSSSLTGGPKCFLFAEAVPIVMRGSDLLGFAVIPSYRRIFPSQLKDCEPH